MEFDSDGVRLHYELHGPEDRPPVVLVHGFASAYQLNWVGTRWQETMLNAGYRVVGLDCRGHGSSDKPHDPRAYSPALMAADVRRLLDELHIAAARYIGYSMGARIGLQAVIDFPDRIVSAVLGGLGISGTVEEAEKIAARRARKCIRPFVPAVRLGAPDQRPRGFGGVHAGPRSQPRI
jgi:pimeloyl-ACP methyl ester carboxylesterase